MKNDIVMFNRRMVHDYFLNFLDTFVRHGDGVCIVLFIRNWGILFRCDAIRYEVYIHTAGRVMFHYSFTIHTAQK